MKHQDHAPAAIHPAGTTGRAGSVQGLLGLVLVVGLLGLAVANIALRAGWRQVEDGVLWTAAPDGVVAKEVSAGSAAVASGIRVGDVLLAINGQPIEGRADVDRFFEEADPGTELEYTVLRLETKELVHVRLAMAPHENLALYIVLASVGIFTLCVGASVRVRRPRDPATLHFFWLSLAFFGVLGFTPLYRFDRLDWFFYWADAISQLLLAPLFLHFALVFPERPRAWVRSPMGARALPLLYLPAAALGAARAIALVRGPSDPRFYAGVVQRLDRLDPFYLSVYLSAALLVLLLAFRQVRSLTARRQLRWIAWGTLLGGTPFAAGYAMPFVLGATPSLAMKLLAIPLGLIPLAFASAIVRYRLLDVEVIIKRTLVYAAAVSAIVVIYSLLLRAASVAFLGASDHNTVVALLATLVVVLLARPVKAGIQATFDRAFYRDRYDYRRALVGFARDLTTDLDLGRLSERLVQRVTETLLVERMALMLADDQGTAFTIVRGAGVPPTLAALSAGSALGARLAAGQPVALDDPFSTRAFPGEEVEFWREQELFYFIPCVSKSRTRAVFSLGRKTSGEPLSSEDVALLTAVAAQVATALENGRLYRQLRLKAEEVNRMREFSDSILESLDAGLVVADTDGRIVKWNRALERLYGVSRADAIGRRLGDVFDMGFVGALEAARRESPAGSTLSRLALAARGGGDSERLVNVTTMPLQAQEGEESAIAGTVIIMADVTARVRLEEQLQIAEKMASIGMLAAGVAHEVNTPLTGISSYTQMLLDGADPTDPRTELLEKIERQTFRAAKIVNGLLNLSRPGNVSSSDRGRVDVNGVINDVLALLEHQFKVSRIQVRRELAAPAPIVIGIEYKLQQVFLNLFLNARDAMPKGGWLSVTTRSTADGVEAVVSDTGAGIPREHLSRIYDPFFTTKATGQGTGLGLSITYGIVREHDGSIDCHSSPGEGTRFMLRFPPPSTAVARPSRAAN
jgi:PAS domain S-box-containing protein